MWGFPACSLLLPPPRIQYHPAPQLRLSKPSRDDNYSRKCSIFTFGQYYEKESLHYFQIFVMLRSQENGVCQHLTKKEFPGNDVDLSGGLVVQYFCNCAKCTQQQIDLDWAKPALCNCGDARTPMAPLKTCTHSRRRAHLLFFKPDAVTKPLQIYEVLPKEHQHQWKRTSIKAQGGAWWDLGLPGRGSLPCSPPSAACGKIATRCASSRARHHHTTSDLMKLLWDRSLIDIFPGDCMYA